MAVRWCSNNYLLVKFLFASVLVTVEWCSNVYMLVFNNFKLVFLLLSINWPSDDTLLLF